MKVLSLIITLGFALGFLSRPGCADIGPMVLVEFPHGLDLGVEWKLSDHWSVGAAAGNLYPLPQFDSVNVSVTNAELNARWHPFGGAFFLGVLVGEQILAASSDQGFVVNGVGTLNANLRLSLNSPYITPHLGWMWGGKSFVFGLEGGVQIPVAASTTFNVNLDNSTYNQYLTEVESLTAYQQLQTKIQNTGNDVGVIVLPYAAVRFGWFF